MKKIIFSIVVFYFAANVIAQEVNNEYDKFKKIGRIYLKDYIDLKCENKTTKDFEINLSKVTMNDDTIFVFIVYAQADYQTYAGSDLQAILLLDDSISIDLHSRFGDVNYITNYVYKYYLEYIIEKKDLMKLYYANKVEMKSYLHGDSFQASFRKDDKKILNNFLKKYILKGEV